MTFDPKTHKFGMAYIADNSKDCGGIYYLLSDAVRCQNTDVNREFNIDRDFRDSRLTRAPEHDLVPASDVQPLIDALIECKLQCDEDLESLADKALSAYQTKRGA